MQEEHGRWRKGGGVSGPWAAPLASALLALLLFSPVIDHFYVYDGLIIVNVDSRLEDPWFGLEVWGAQWWEDGAWLPISRPLTQFTYWVQVQLHGRDPVMRDGRVVFNVFHAVDLALFMALCAGAAHLTRRLVEVGSGGRRRGVAAGWLMGLAFAAQPVHTEVVASTVGRADTLALGFTVMGLLLWLRWRGNVTWWRAVWLGLVVLAAGLSKETGYLLAPMMALVECGLRRLEGRALLGRPLPWRVAATILVVVVIGYVQRQVMRGDVEPMGAVAMDNPLVRSQGATEAVLSRVMLAGRAGRLLAWPIATNPEAGGLAVMPTNSPDYSPKMLMPTRDWTNPDVLVGLAIFGGWLVLTWWGWRGRHVAILALLCWPVAWAIPSNMFVLIGTIFGERLLMPISLFGPMAVVMLIRWERLHRTVAVLGCGAAGVVIGLQAYASFVYVPHWENNFTLQAYTVDRHPASGRFQGFWARAVLEYAMTQEGHAKQRLLADAERTANAALNQWPQNQGPYAILGVVEYERGNRERADEYLEYARQHAMGPGFTEFIMAYLGMMEDVEEIRTEIEVFEQRRDTGELDREDRRRLARLYGTVKEWEDAEEAFEVAIDEPESDVDFLYAYLDVLIMRDKHADALEVYRRLIELEPNQWSHYVDAGIVGVMAGARIEDEAERGRVMSEALGWLHRAMELSPGSPEPWSAMADYFVLNGDWERARMASDEALLRSSPSDIRHRQFQMQRELIEKNL